MAWWITEWSRERGRGRIKGTLADPIAFDASVALVDDFKIGEQVHVELERHGDGWRVTKIAPDDPRFTSPQTVPKGTAPLDAGLQLTVQATLDRIRLQEAYRPSAIIEDSLVLQGEEGYSYPPPHD